MISAWRIGYCPSPQPADAVLLASLGYGSTLGNGRWHVKGALQVVYCGASRALTQLEKRVHSNGATPRNQVLMRLDLPEGAAVTDVSTLGLPADWHSNEGATQALGVAWLSSVSGLGLWVPSFIEHSENNLLLNPVHPQYSSIHLTVERNPFRFDPRLF